MTKHLILLWFYSMVINHAIGQREGDAWIMGYATSINPHNSVLELDFESGNLAIKRLLGCLLYTSPSPRDRTRSRMPSSA